MVYEALRTSANRRWGARPWLARTLLDCAEALINRGGPAAFGEARPLVEQAAGIVAELGAAGLAPRIERLGARCDVLGPTAAGPRPHAGR